ncbi:MAG: hypothetical protein PF689_12805 [Deltaproteobacteria bacterium]|jgi:hypothetical protein|nr:hypothetical protein [Deltaproteobacteria bacterium]
MQPYEIAMKIGDDKIEELADEFNSSQFKRVLLSGKVSTRLPLSTISNKKRKKVWKKRLLKAVSDENLPLVAKLFYEFLLNRRRNMLISYLDLLNVTHRNGETEETFLKTIPEKILKDQARNLTNEFSRSDVGIYLHYLDYHQESEVFLNDSEFVNFLLPEA